MPRKTQQILTLEQIDEVLNNTPNKLTKPTWKAVQDFLQREKNRRMNAGKVGGRKRIYEGDSRERHNLAVKTHREKIKNNE